MTTAYDFAPSAPGPLATFTITKNYLVVAVVGVDLSAGVPGTPITFPL